MRAAGGLCIADEVQVRVLSTDSFSLSLCLSFFALLLIIIVRPGLDAPVRITGPSSSKASSRISSQSASGRGLHIRNSSSSICCRSRRFSIRKWISAGCCGHDARHRRLVRDAGVLQHVRRQSGRDGGRPRGYGGRGGEYSFCCFLLSFLLCYSVCYCVLTLASRKRGFKRRL